MAYYGITSSSQFIDIATISDGCTQIEKAAEKFAECAKKVMEAAAICDANALSVDKTTMQPQLEADAQYIQSMQEAVKGFTSEIRNVSQQVYSAQSQELKEYLASQQEQESD